MPQLKYGCNPHQSPASYSWVDPGRPPFEVLAGKPGYINLLDAVNAWRLVKELRAVVGLPAAASFKHVSPAGAAVAVPLDDGLRRTYGFDEDLSPLACAYLRARGADPSSSFGDFIGLSDTVDLPTARILEKVVADGAIAPGYEPAALEILRAKKKGAFIVLRADPSVEPPAEETREAWGLRLTQSANTLRVGPEHLRNVVTREKILPEAAVRDLLLGLVTVKYTQSNSVGYALGGQMIGIGAGQQSRVDCTKLAGRKADTWRLRQHEAVLGLRFKDAVKRQERINWRLRYAEGDLTGLEAEAFAAALQAPPPPPLAEAEKRAWIGGLAGVSFVSDAFLPFRDNIDHAVKHGVRYIAQTGGSERDDDVTRAADDYGLVMAHTGIRLFHH